MAGVHVTVELDSRLINAMLTEVTGASALRGARAVEIRARVNAPWETGKLAKSIVPRLVRRGVVTEYTVGTDVEYASYQEFGVPHRIYPVRAKALRFRPKGSNVYIFRAWTSGVPATHFMGRAIDSLTFQDFLP